MSGGSLCAMAKSQLSKVLLLLFILMTASNGQQSDAQELDEIKVLLLLSYKIQESTEQPLYIDGPEIQPAAELAVDQINQREDLLAGYSVNMTVANSACNLIGHTATNFVAAFFHSGVRYAGIVGPTCSESVEFVSSITGHEDVAILNFHIANSQRLTDRNKYRYSFSTVSSTNPLVVLVVRLMREKKWSSVAVLYEQKVTVFLNAYDLLVENLPTIYPEGRISFSAPISENNLPFSSIIQQHLRVTIVLSSSGLARQIACLIQRHYHHLTFPAYQFVFVGLLYSDFYSPVSFTFNDRHYECYGEEITQVMEGFLLTDFHLFVGNATELESGITYAKYLQEYDERVNDSTTVFANPIYDGVWSLALALNNSIPRLNEIGLDLVDYTYGHREATEIIREEVLKVRFQGASGHISYSKDTGFTSGSIPLHQVVNNIGVMVGYYDEDKEVLILMENATFIESSFKSTEQTVHPALASLFLLLLLVTLVLISSTHILTLVFYKFPTVRASSYRLGQLAFIGCYLIALCFLCFTVQKVAPTTSVNTTYLCVIQVWSLPLGLTLILGTVAAKTWRLYRIFFHLKKPGNLLHDWVLFSIVLVLAAVDVILCSVWTAEFQFTTLRHEMFADNNMIEVRAECSSEYYYAWFGALTIYQGLIMASAVVLALLTRNIHHKSFKTNSVIFLVYFLTIVLFLGFPLYLILHTTNVTGVNVEYMVLSATYLTVVCLCFVFLFFPPILSLLRVKLFHKIPGLKRYSKSVSTKY